MVVLPPGVAQCGELLLAFGKKVLGALQVAVEDVYAVLEGFKADPLPYAAQFGGGFAMLFFGHFAAVGLRAPEQGTCCALSGGE